MVAERKTYVYVGSGSYGGDNGKVTVYRLNRTSRTLTFVSEHPAGGLASSLVIDEPGARLYAGDESKMGVHSFTIDPETGSLTNLGATISDNAPVHLSLSPDRGYLLAANYNQGNVDVYPLGADGKAQPSLGATPTGTQAHCVVIDANGHVLVANKGANTISHFSFAEGILTPLSPSTTALESPRHIFIRSGKAYVVSETADQITGYSFSADGSLSENWQTMRLDTNDAGNDTGAEVQVTPNGKYLYASNRGASNTLVAYDVQRRAPQFLEFESTLGTTPRDFEIDPRGEVLIVGNQDSNSVVLFAIAADGMLHHASTLDVDYQPFFVAMAQF